MRNAARSDGTLVFDVRVRKDGETWVRYDPRVAPQWEKGAALVEVALVLPILTLLIVGGLILGAGQLTELRYQQAAYETARAVSEGHQTPSDAVLSLTVRFPKAQVCVWAGNGDGPCTTDGATVDRVQVVLEGPTFHHPAGSITPHAESVVLTP